MQLQWLKFRIDGFVLAIGLVVALAWWFPGWGSPESPVPLDLLGSLGISLIFFFYGLKLSREKIRRGLQNYKLHLLVQLTTFLIFPLLVLLWYPLAGQGKHAMFWLAFMFLAALPSTVSSSVVMVALARGNVPAAIFNASISGLIGIVVTPLWMGLFLSHAGGDFNLSSIYLKLLTEILLPLALGLLLQTYLGPWALAHARLLTLFDKSVILLIIYKSFAQSFLEKVFFSLGLPELLLITAGSILLFYAIYHLSNYLAKHLQFSPEDRITARYCGTKKSLVHGTVFAKILFSASMPMGIILLPLMIFHAYQILAISIDASKLARQKGL